ncbi:MAG: zeta toxin family protein [Bacteroidia bacterium]|nr:zeta toxin family protein [Bacteroidia bacterium]
MSIAYTRKLDHKDVVEHFLNTTLEIKAKESDIKLIVEVEKQLANNESYSISNNGNVWQRPYNSHESRRNLRNIITSELFSKKRLKNDDKIKFGVGGSKPSKLLSQKKAFIVIGLPAAGKSGIANKIADITGSYIIDNDYAKRKIPEYYDSPIGASVTHEESDAIIFGNKTQKDFNLFTPLIFKCVEKGHNMVIPKIGAKPASILELVNTLTDFCGYQVHLILVNLNRSESTKRAFDRFKRSNRYVPLSLIFDGYANDPTLTYFRLKEIKNPKILSFGEVDTTEKPYAIRGDKNSIIHKLEF